MNIQIERRVATLEAGQPDARTVSPEKQQADMVALAARCGLTEAQAHEQFDGWPKFAYAFMTGAVVDPSAQTLAIFLRENISPSQAYLDMLG